MNFAINTSIFRDYDIRGVYPEEINKETFYVLGQALAKYISGKEIALGRDCRLQSESLFKSLTYGLTDQGMDVINLGMISTEMLYFASGKYKFPASCIISASHNPPQYNGLKIVKRGVVPVHGAYGLPQIKKLALSGNFVSASKKGKIIKKNILKQWVDHALSFVDIDKIASIKVVIDAGNGMGGISWQEVIDKLPAKIIPLYFKPDGNFPHHLPDPIKKQNLVDLKKTILRNRADLGFALDGDADRIFVLDEAGDTLSGTVTTAILTNILLEKYGPAPVLYNAVVGRVVPELISSFGGRAVRVRVGHSFIKEKMRQEKAIFAGEHSGHFYFRDNFNAESSFIAGLLLLEYLSSQDKPISQIVKKYDKYQSSGEINFRLQDPNKTILKVERNFKNCQKKDHLDGLSVFYPNFWFNLRTSKTEPLLRLNLEADDREILEKQLDRLKKLIASEKGELAS